MRIYRDLEEIEHNDNTVVTLGTFDGLHLGHQQIVKDVVDKASGNGGRNFLITFYPHPRKVIPGNENVKLLSTLNEKIEVLEKHGIENLLVINFTKEFSQQTPEQFVRKYIINGIGVSEIIIGYDHHFGKGRGGNKELLQEIGEKENFSVTAVEEYILEGETVSSSSIRKALFEGDISKANKMLGRYYTFNGIVIHGDNRGKDLGFPTANIRITDEDKLLPAVGIYFAESIINGDKFYGLLSIGSRPTFHKSGEVIPEFYIFDFNRSIYNTDIRINMIEKIRNEEKFNSAEELIMRMNKDKEEGRKILEKLIN